jgi:transcriptional regulator with XRE-family HTH domain
MHGFRWFFNLIFGSMIDTIFVSMCQAFFRGTTVKHKILVYNGRHDTLEGSQVMPKRVVQLNKEERFGDRMARLRKEAGYSQRDLARETGISQRMIAYYEKQTQYPPTHLLPILAKALGVSADHLLGIEAPKTSRKTRDNRLWRRFGQIEKMEAKDKRQVLQFLDTVIERDQLKRRTGT